MASEMPHNLELERAVLSILLDGRHASSVHTVRSVIEHPLYFFSRNHRIIYAACLSLDDAGEHVDVSSVGDYLSRSSFSDMMENLGTQEQLLSSDAIDGLSRQRMRKLLLHDANASLDESCMLAIGGFNTLSDIVASTGFAHSLSLNASKIADYYRKRRFISSAQTLTDEAYCTTKSADDILDSCGHMVLKLSAASKSELHSLGDVAKQAIESLNAERRPGIKTGVNGLDELLLSMRPGGLYILAARPGVGKTSFALKITRNVAIAEYDSTGVLFFSLEVAKDDLAKKMLCAEAGVNFRSLEPGSTLMPDEQKRLGIAADSFKDLDVSIMDVSDLTVSGLRSSVKRRALEHHGLRLVVIDYLQLLSSSKPGSTEYEKISEISRTLKILAREINVPVLALSQMSRDSEKGAGAREPRLSDLRGSGSIEQDADAVVFLHREDPDGPPDNRQVKLVVAKNRFGPTGHCKLVFKPSTMRFDECAKVDDHEYQTTRAVRDSAPPSPDEDLFA